MTVARTLLLLAITWIASVATAHAACVGGAAYKGNYGILVTGASNQGGYGKYLSGVLTFNGACGLSGQVTGGENGSATTTTLTGSYGSISNSSTPNAVQIQFFRLGETTAETYTVATATTANETYGLETDSTSVATITLTPLGHSNFTNANLSGTFVFYCAGNETEFSDLNYLTFDGNGNLSGYDVYNNDNDQGTAPITGTYSVNKNGTFAATLSNNFQGYHMAGVITHGLAWIKFIYTISNGDAVAACDGKN